MAILKRDAAAEAEKPMVQAWISFDPYLIPGYLTMPAGWPGFTYAHIRHRGGKRY